MKFYTILTHFVLLFSFPALVVPLPATHINILTKEIQPDQTYLYSYDDILDLLQELEDGDLENRCSLEELDRIYHFIALLARNGILPNTPLEERALERDIDELLKPEYGYLFSMHGEDNYILVPYANGDSQFCKSWFKKRVHQAKKFVKKHKKAILIGAAIVVAATVVLCAVSIATTAAATAGVAALSRSDEEKNKTTSATQKSLNLSAAMEEHISSFKELVVEDELLSTKTDFNFGEKTRFLGSFLAHETLDGISKMASMVPGILQEAIDGGKLIHPNFMQPQGETTLPHSMDFVRDFQKMIHTGHQKIDQIFTTDLTDYFQLSKHGSCHHLLGEKVIGMLPPPGALNAGLGSSQVGRIPTTMASPVRGWKVGQSITNRTIFGTIPKWSTVRRRHWKNEALLHPEKYEMDQLERMRQGLAPQRFNMNTGRVESMELHHTPPQKEGGLFDFIEVWPEEHALIDEFRHIGN